MRWFTSDLHLGSAWAARMRYCGTDVAKHDATIAARWDAKVGSGDEVWILGDLSGELDFDALSDWRRARPGTKHLALGNNDVGMERSDRPLDSVASDARTVLGGYLVVMSHYPDVAVDANADALLHGHTHRRQRISRPLVDQVPRVHVGWEAWRRLVPEPELANAVASALALNTGSSQ
jgi:calcineurin-like phosphoesterase family protein